MRTYDNGCFFTVAFTKLDSYEFKTRWPCSTVRGAGSFQFQKDNDDLVDVGGSAAKGDGPDWVAFADDCKAYGLAHLKPAVGGAA